MIVVSTVSIDAEINVGIHSKQYSIETEYFDNSSIYIYFEFTIRT